MKNKTLIAAIAIICISLNLTASDDIDMARYMGSDIHALTPVEGYKSVIVSYRLVNDTIDVFDIKEEELSSSTQNYSSIGDLDGFGLKARYAPLESLLLQLSLTKDSIEYGDGKLRNTHFEVFARKRLISSRYTFFNGFAIDGGFVYDHGQKLSFTSASTIQSAIKNILQADKVTINSNKVVVKKGANTYASLTSEPVYASIDSMRDATVYLRAILEKKITNYQLLNCYAKVGHTTISTKLRTNPELIAKAKSEGYEVETDLGRDEWTLAAGLTYSMEFHPGIDLMTEWGYRYEYYFRDSDIKERDYNHILTADFTFVLDKEWSLHMGGRIMFSQLNGQIPYLYNRYSKTTFDHRYGYVYAGVGYEF